MYNIMITLNTKEKGGRGLSTGRLRENWLLLAWTLDTVEGVDFRFFFIDM